MTDKERLENMSPIGFDLNGDVLLKSEDYHWLMEQAERVEELEMKLSINTNNMKQLQNKVERYKQALEEISNADWNSEGLDAERELDKVTDVAFKTLEESK